MAITFAGWRTWGPFAIPWFVSVIKGDKKKPTPEVEIIGVKDPDLLHRTSSGTAITETTFDVTTRPDEARILFTNASGVDRVLTGCYVRGKVIKKVGGSSGYCNDKHVNYEAIARDGESKFELGNDYICTITQVNKLADWHWKLNKTKKHIYTVSLKGFQSYFEPGEWYVLTIGSAGTAEYIDSTVECYSVRCAYDAKGSMGTQVSFREVEENWKFDSNAVARYVAAGGHGRTPQGRVTTIAASNYSGYADYYCDGTSGDASVIQNAINTVEGSIELTEGQFNIWESIYVNKNDMYISGRGSKTNLVWWHETDTGSIMRVGTSTPSTDYKSNIGISKMMLSSCTSSYGSYVSVHLLNINNALFEDNVISGFATRALIAEGMMFSNINSNKIDGSTGGKYGASVYGYRTNFINNEILNIHSTSLEVMGFYCNGNNCIISNNHVHDLENTATTYATGTIYGAYVSGTNNVFQSNFVDTITSTGGTTGSYAVFVNGSNLTISGNKIQNNSNIGLYRSTDATNALISGNYCLNNGADTGITNVNLDNFLSSGSTSLIIGNSWQ